MNVKKDSDRIASEYEIKAAMQKFVVQIKWNIKLS